MPNTNPSDLDREALKAALDAWTWQMSYTSGEIEENLQSAVQAYLAALPRASGVPEAEALAWYTQRSDGTPRDLTAQKAVAARWSEQGFVVCRLYAAPPPVAAPSGELLSAALEVLEHWNCVADYEWTKDGVTWQARFPVEGYDASLIRLYEATHAIPPSPIASEPKDAGSGDEQAPEDANSRLDSAYRERNQVVAALAKCFPSGVKKTAIEGWDIAWHNCVYIDLPTGQASWHFHDDDASFFEGLTPYKGEWDGHSTPEKYERLSRLKDAGSGEGQELTPDPVEYADDLLARIGTDGSKWASEFIKIADKLGHKGIDEGWMIGWFANAIEAGRSAGRAERNTQ